MDENNKIEECNSGNNSEKGKIAEIENNSNQDINEDDRKTEEIIDKKEEDENNKKYDESIQLGGALLEEAKVEKEEEI